MCILIIRVCRWAATPGREDHARGTRMVTPTLAFKASRPGQSLPQLQGAGGGQEGAGCGRVGGSGNPGNWAPELGESRVSKHWRADEDGGLLGDRVSKDPQVRSPRLCSNVAGIRCSRALGRGWQGGAERVERVDGSAPCAASTSGCWGATAEPEKAEACSF